MRVNDFAAAIVLMAGTLLCPVVSAQTPTAVPQDPATPPQTPDPIQVTSSDGDAFW
jgi:hypothetical protein